MGVCIHVGASGLVRKHGIYHSKSNGKVPRCLDNAQAHRSFLMTAVPAL